ncbi:MAG: portal protein [Campylobacteraceae bacterium]|nr:portal protein [Campylobacteraceae bacterium]
MDYFLFATLLLAAVASITITLSRSVGLGSILGLLIAGIIIGPYTPGPFLTSEVAKVRQFTEFGVVLLLFIIGLDMHPKKLWSMKKEVFGLGTLQVLVTGLVIGFYLTFFMERPAVAYLLGFTFSLSSTALVMQLLQEKGEVASTHGKASFAVLLLQDLAIVPLLAVVPLLSDDGHLPSHFPIYQQILITIGMLGFLYIFGRYLAPLAFEKAAKQNNRDAFLFLSILCVVLSAVITNEIGLSMALGAFITGVLLSSSKYSFQIQASIEPFRGLLMSIFFVAVGMSIDFKALMVDPEIFTLNIVIIAVLKIVILFCLALLFKIAVRPALKMSLLLSQSGEFGFVLLGAAKSANVVTDLEFTFGVGLISISMLITPLLYNFALKLSSKLSRSSPISFIKPSIDTTKVVIAGFADTGKIIASMLKKCGIEYIAFDTNPTIVKDAKKLGEPVFYGDISDEKMLQAIKIEQAQVVIIAISSSAKALRAITHIKSYYPNIVILAKSMDIKTMDKMILQGANLVVSESTESSLRIGSEALLLSGMEQSDVDTILELFRKNDYALLREMNRD